MASRGLHYTVSTGKIMQTTKVSLYSLRSLLKDKIKGYATVGYTVRPGFSNGLLLTDRKTFGQYVGF